MTGLIVADEPSRASDQPVQSTQTDGMLSVGDQGSDEEVPRTVVVHRDGGHVSVSQVEPSGFELPPPYAAIPLA